MDPLAPVVVPFVPKDFMERYATNMARMTYQNRKPLEYYGRCAQCRGRGILWKDLKFYWFEFVKNFLCQACYEGMSEDEKHERWVEGQLWRLRMYERRQARNAAGIKRKGP